MWQNKLDEARGILNRCFSNLGKGEVENDDKYCWITNESESLLLKEVYEHFKLQYKMELRYMDMPKDELGVFSVAELYQIENILDMIDICLEND